jgi:carbonic anhydrase
VQAIAKITSMKTVYEKLFDGNKKWAEEMRKIDPQFFEKHAKEQKPPILWIGCSDSRVPANEVTGTLPGEIFVHRNIANMVVHTDLSMLSVLDYSVNILKVTDVIVCGHYGCGGIMAALGNRPIGIVENWLRNIKDVYRLHQRELDAVKNKEKRAERLVELNVIEQVLNLSKTYIVQNAWETGQKLSIHGIVYDLRTGILNDLEATMKDQSELPKYYHVHSEVPTAVA